jgi:hypothetical protein
VPFLSVTEMPSERRHPALVADSRTARVELSRALVTQPAPPAIYDWVLIFGSTELP